MINYSLGDFLIRIKNAVRAGQKNVTVSYTNLNFSAAQVLKKEKILSDVKKDKDELKVTIAYVKKAPLLMSLKLISKPGRRVYMKAVDLSGHKGISFYLISTPAGVMTSKEAAKKNVGGEVIAEIQ